MKQDEKLAKEIVRLLDASADNLDYTQVHRLESARMQAVARHQVGVAGSSGLVEVFSAYVHQRKLLMSAALLVGALVIGFLVTQQIAGQDSGELGDAFLLSSELPPEAFLDQGFNTWLEQTSQR